MEVCEECGGKLHQITRTEKRPDFWGAPAYEEIVIGEYCPDCGYQEEF